MAKIELKDGRRIPMVEPNLWDTAAVEKEMGWKRKEYAEWMRLSSMTTALGIFASLRRAGIPDVSFKEVCELGGFSKLIAEPGDLARAESDEEGEQSPDPQPAASATPDLGDVETD